MNKVDRSYIIELRKKLKKNLPDVRYEHSLGVEYMSAALAMVHGVDIEKAEIAGLLHDCAKILHDESKVAHAFFGPEVAHDMYGIEDEEILSAIKWHTTGKADMTDLEKIVFIADFIEPSRANLPIMEEVRKTAFKDLTYAVYLITERTLDYLNGKNSPVEEHTMQCLEFLKENGIYDK